MSTERLGGVRVEVDDRLLARLEGICAVDAGDAARTDHAADWWPIARHWSAGGMVAARPAVVAFPTDTPQVAAVLAACHEARVPVTPTAGRSGVCGGSVPVFGGVALDLCGLSGVGAVDGTSLLVDVAAGTRGDVLEEKLRRDHGLTTGHWPQSMALSTVGGWVACRSAGQYSTRYGKIEDMVAGLEVALADGRVVRTGGRSPREATGPDLRQFFLGSEGTLGVVTEVCLRAHPVAPAERRAAFGFATFVEGLEACRRILRRGATPAVLRLYDHRESMRSFAVDGRCLLLALDEAEPRVADAVLHIVGEECAGAERLDDALVDHWLATRNDVSALAELTDRGVVADTCEVGARWSQLAGVHAAAMAALEGVPGTAWASAHQSHSYSDGGCLYLTFAGTPEGEGEGAAEDWYGKAWDAVTAAALGQGAALSHHHGIGINRGRFLAQALGPAFDVLVALKHALDPHGILNPGKLGLPSPWGAPPWP
ncbi:MAG: FAD-binding oxidoreductase [Actinomycetota bacterium]|nr:FAD-binding oxidoreductase [Actinomycetota bacterium]